MCILQIRNVIEMRFRNVIPLRYHGTKYVRMNDFWTYLEGEHKYKVEGYNPNVKHDMFIGFMDV